MEHNHDNIVSGLDKSAKEVGNKFTKDNWNNIERKLSDFDLKIKDELINVALNLFNIVYTDKQQDIKIKSLGDEFYSFIRKNLMDYKLIKKQKDDDNKNNKNNNKLKKADLIRQENTMRIILDDLKRAENNFDYEDFRYPSTLTSNIIEMRCIGLLQCAKFIIINQKKYLDENNDIKTKKINFIYNIIIGFHKLIKTLEEGEYQSLNNSSQQVRISSIFIQDLKIILEEIKQLYKFDALVAYKVSPQLLFYTDLDNANPSKNFKPYSHQITMCDNLYNSLKSNTPLIITLRTMTGTGKTTTVVALAKIIGLAKNILTEHKNTILIFCCNLRSVMDQASQWLFNADIPFAVGSIDSDKTVKIINNYNCKSDSARVAIVCSPEVCVDLLVNSNDDTQYILFLDEPTIGVDVKSSTAKLNVKLMSMLPKISILSSATLPPNGYDWIQNNHKIRHGDGTYIDIYSNKIHIGCEIKTFDGELVIPHLNRTEFNNLKTTINNIRQLPFLGRAYTINVVKHMYELMKDENIKDLPNIPQLFKDIDNLNTDEVRNLAMIMLEKLSDTNNNDLVTKICSSKIKMYEPRLIDDNSDKEVSENSENSDFEWEKDDDNVKQEINNKVIFNKLGTSEAHKYLRQNLIATVNPYNFVKENFNDLLEDVKQDIQSLKRIHIIHSQELNLWQKELNKLEKQKFKNDLQRTKMTDELQSAKPVLKFPFKYQINTKEHIKTYAKTRIAIDKSAIRDEINMSEIPELPIEDDLVLLLYCGVGIYTANLHPLYTTTVLRLASENKLAYLISDSSISYGTNYPINRVFIMEDLSEAHSINTVFQLMSRAGRVGKSWIAEAYIGNQCAQRIINCSNFLNDELETDNINELYNQIIKENEIKDNAIIQQLQEIENAKLEEEKRKQRELEELLEKERLIREKRDEEERIRKEKLELEKNQHINHIQINQLDQQIDNTRTFNRSNRYQNNRFNRNNYVDRPERTIDRPERTIDRPERTIDRPERTIDRPERTIDRPERTIDRPENNSRNYPRNNNRNTFRNIYTKTTSETGNVFKREVSGNIIRRNGTS
jgi:hypothetical protein